MVTLLLSAASWAMPTSTIASVRAPSTVPRAPSTVAMCAAAPEIVRGVAAGKHVQVYFADGSAYNFHSLWLRDACRDDEHVVGGAGERYLTATPVGPSGVRACSLVATGVRVCDDGLLHIRWGDESFGPHEMAADPPRSSRFPASFLRTYAELVAQPLAAGTRSLTPHDDLAFLTPYSGFPSARAPADDEVQLWRAAVLPTSRRRPQAVREAVTTHAGLKRCTRRKNG